MRHQVKLTKLKEGVAVSRPGLLGCWSHRVQQKKKIWKTFKDAIMDYLSVVDEHLRK